MLCGDPAQLAPVRARPFKQLALTASAPSPSLALTNPFTKQASDDTQTLFHTLFGQRSNCQATEDDWRWLQIRCPTCLR